MTNELHELFEIHLENHLYELKTLLTSQLQILGISTTLEKTEPPEELSPVQKQLLIMFMSFYHDCQKYMMKTLEMKATANTSPQSLAFIDRIKAFHQELNEFKKIIPQNNFNQFLGSIGLLSLDNAFLLEYPNEYFFTRPRLIDAIKKAISLIRQVIDEILKAISLNRKDSWATQTNDTIEYSRKIFNNIKNNPTAEAEIYSSAFHALKNKHAQATHKDLIQCGRKLGYSFDDEGLCQGYTLRWIEATLAKQQSRFLNRTYKIKALNRLLNEGKTIEELKKQPEWQDILWDIKAFFESLYLYQNAHQESSIFAKKLTQDDIAEISELASSEEIIKIGGIKRSQILRYDEFNKESLLSTLGKLEEKIKESHYQNPVCFLLRCSSKRGRHAINVTYLPSHHSWQWMDVNLPLEKSEKLEHLFDFTDGKYWENLPYFDSYDNFSISAILPKESTTDLENALTTIKKFECTNPKINQLILFDASTEDDLETTIALLAHPNINPNQANSVGTTPLIISAQKGHLKVVHALLAHADVDPNRANSLGKNPLIIAAQKGHLEVVQALLAHPNINPNQANSVGTTPLTMAAQQGHLKVVQALLAHDDVDPNQALNNGTTPLLIAAQYGHLEVVQALLDHKEIKPNKVNENDETPLSHAAEYNKLEIVQALLKNDDIDPNQADSNGLTPLFMAAKKGHLEVVQALLAHPKISPNQASNNGTTPLIMAALEGHLEVVQALLKNDDVDPNQADSVGKTPLFIAAQNNKFEMVEWLLHLENIDINKPSQSTQEQLKGFVSQKTNDVIERMNEHIKQYQQKYPYQSMIEVTPEEIAMILGHKDICELIQSKKQMPISKPFGP